MYSIKWEEKSIKELEDLEKSIAIRIIRKIENLKENPFESDIKRLKNSDNFRLRVGDYRIIFSISNELITIWKIGHRKNIYE